MLVLLITAALAGVLPVIGATNASLSFLPEVFANNTFGTSNFALLLSFTASIGDNGNTDDFLILIRDGNGKIIHRITGGISPLEAPYVASLGLPLTGITARPLYATMYMMLPN